ncbi:MAG TPA: hypothetical protein PK079_07160 [Leptospiraceae bacterium]|nr:hypothetical protein [Leptospiraceae bacterium]HMY32299.1 hypothetical protein [Leptospiraceae bacterium]HMZ62499.1 hypothetical protein [Leptospiraceae bacterium]HNC54757.1 hypothetical protein [Leptospiraceae bacterium]HNE52936.1 hypothetical protein [Leptospiraceae bacterium]
MFLIRIATLKCLSILFFLFFVALDIYSQSSKEIPFLRATETALQTSVYTLVSKDTNVRLKIIGVVHVADKEYYLNIQKIINELDFLYYEGIRVSSKMHSKNFSKNYYAQTLEEMDTRRSIKKYSDLKSEIARFLNFADQSELLKPKQNWINADMDFQQFVEMLKNYKIGFDSLSTNFSNDSKSISKDYSELMQMENTDSAEYSTKVLSFKKKMSQNLVKSAFDLCFLEEMRLPREAIIIERNKIALSFVKPKFNSQVPLELGLLYGAAHTPNFVEILTREYNFEIESYEWLDAWSLQN